MPSVSPSMDDISVLSKSPSHHEILPAPWYLGVTNRVSRVSDDSTEDVYSITNNESLRTPATLDGFRNPKNNHLTCMKPWQKHGIFIYHINRLISRIFLSTFTTFHATKELH